MIGDTLGHYKVLSRLGGGGGGEVFLAEDERLQRPVALKLLAEERLGDAAADTRLLDEARVASALSHPNIAVIYEVGQFDRPAGRSSYIAMEYVPGQTLAEFGQRDGLDLDAVLEVARQLTDALARAHAAGVVHRDVKPTNVMVAQDGRVKVLDFGLARRRALPRQDDSTWSRDPTEAPEPRGLVGTLAYMAPEQALGEEVDARADVFGVGVVLYELVAGHRPFEGRSAVQVLDALLHQPPPPLRTRFPDPRVPALEACLRRMLAKDPRERHASMREVSVDLERVARGEPVPVPSAAEAGRVVAVLGFRNITGSGEDDWLGTGIAETLTADLRRVAGLTVVAHDRVHEVLRRLELQAGVPEEALAVEAGREFGARWVVSGGFQRAGDAIRVTGVLTEVATGRVAHTVKLDGRLGEIFDLQDRIARELSAGLSERAAPAERMPEETLLVEAYEAFSRGVLNLRVETYESLDRAVLLFERATSLDPRYARAHLELGSSYSTKADYLAMPALHQRALDAYRRALELDPRLPRAWREMGTVLVSLGREDEGLQAIRHALQLDPEDPGALAAMGRALFIGWADFAGAARYLDRALERNPQGGWYALQLAHCAALLREFERGETAVRRAIELQEAFLSGQEGVRIVGAYVRLGHLRALQGGFAEALEAFGRERDFLARADHALRSRISIELHMRTGAAQLALGLAGPGRASLDAAVAAFEERARLGADEPFTRYYAACAYALRGDSEPALACLERALQQRRAFTLARARIEPELETLRRDPRLTRLLA